VLEAQQRKPLTDEQQQRLQEQLAMLVERHAAVQEQMKAAAEAQAEQERVAAAAAQQPPMPEENLRRATIRFVHKGRNLEINIDKSQSFSQPIAQQDDLAGKGIQFTVQPVAVRRVRVVDANGRIQQIEQGPQDEDLLRITNLVVSRSGNAMRFLRIDEEQKQSVLTIPRSRKNNPPTHLLVAQNGDLLRGQLVSATKDKIQFRSRMDALTLDRARVAAIVALSREAEEAQEADGAEGVADAAVGAVAPNIPEVPADDAETVRVVLSDGTRLTFAMQEGMKETLVGEHPLLGACSILVEHVHELQAGGQVRTWPTDFAYDEWKLVSAKEPIFPDMGAGGALPGLGSDSPLVGTPAEDFSVQLADGGRFRLSEHTDKIVVLDFWATWCGPCAVALPKIVEATGQFPPEDVIFIAVNQQETEAAVRDYLTARDWDFTVALDRDGAIGRQFHVEAIPQTVVIGKGGKIERVHIGAHPNLETELQTVLEDLLAPPAEDAAAAESN
jgi:peroxiredoxin